MWLSMMAWHVTTATPLRSPEGSTAPDLALVMVHSSYVTRASIVLDDHFVGPIQHPVSSVLDFVHVLDIFSVRRTRTEVIFQPSRP